MIRSYETFLNDLPDYTASHPRRHESSHVCYFCSKKYNRGHTQI
jgi:hypothetical protein